MRCRAISLGIQVEKTAQGAPLLDACSFDGDCQTYPDVLLTRHMCEVPIPSQSTCTVVLHHHAGATAQLTVASIVDTSNPEHEQKTTRGKKVTAGWSISPTELVRLH